LTALLIFPAFSQASELLYFPIDKTKIQILPQRFEYELINKDKFRLGNTLLDAEKIGFQIQSASRSRYTLKFRWPASLIRKGEIVIKDNVGKAIWKQNLDSVKITKSTETTAEGNKLITDSASFETTDFTESQLSQLRLLPFFRFCVHHEEELTRMYLCSKDLYFKHVGPRVMIKSRDSLHQESFVQINGQVVGNKGIIFLQSTQDPLSMKATLASGASIELDTRLKAVDFVDAYQAGDKMVIKAKGAEPNDDEQIIRHEKDEWTAKLSMDRPVLYLLGEGDIPMRQEFIVKSKLRSESLQIPISSPAEGGTYSSSTTVELSVPSNLQLQATDKNSTVTKLPQHHSGSDTDQWVWEISDLQPGKINHRLLNVETPEEQLIGSTEIFRSYRNELFAGMGLTRGLLDFHFQQAMNKNWSWNLAYRQFVETAPLEPSFSILSVMADYRLTKGLYLKTPSHGLTLSFDDFVSDYFRISSVSVGGYLTYAAPDKWSKIYDWSVFRLKIPAFGSGNGYSLSTSYAAEAVLKKLEGQWSWEFGTRYETYSFTSSSSNMSNTMFTRWSLIAGMSVLF
jgi:hypothetical protein